MNEKQVKLLRYFAKHTGDLALAAQVKDNWHKLTPKAKKKLTLWMKTVIVTMIALTDEQKKQKRLTNMKILEGFAT